MACRRNGFDVNALIIEKRLCVLSAVDHVPAAAEDVTGALQNW